MTDAHASDARSRPTLDLDPPPDPREIREAEWLWLWRRGLALADLSLLSGEPFSAVRRGVLAALERRGELVRDDGTVSSPRSPRDPDGDLVVTWGSSAKAKPTCEDVHPGGPMPAGARLCCWHCHASGLDGHPSLLLRPADVV